jgi:hypothetical protein
MTGMNRIQSAVPATPAEAAVAAATWERRGVLGRLVRLEDGLESDRPIVGEWAPAVPQELRAA